MKRLSYIEDARCLKVNGAEKSIPVAARSMTWVFGRLLARIAGSNATGRMAVSLVSFVCCQVEVSATG